MRKNLHYRRTINKSMFLMFLLLLYLPHQTAFAEIKLPAIISSNMVLQRDAEISLWGWAEPGERITIKCSWLSENLTVTADDAGNWNTEVKTTNSKTLQDIRLSSNASDIRLENLLFGEVWICSGQSNMEQSLEGYTGQPTFGGLEAIALAGNPQLRLFSVKHAAAKKPLMDLESYDAWQEASPNNVHAFSAVAYFFGQQLQKILDVPVGIIEATRGGSSIEAWMSKESLSGFQEVNLDDVDIEYGSRLIPTALYNAMIAPLIPYRIRGALWYQGENNVEEPQKYGQLLPAMVKDWRNRWRQKNFPFYYVQIAPYYYRNLEAFNAPENTAFLREVQFKSLSRIPNSGMAVTLDLGEENVIHPARKKEVADRLLYIALNKTYGFKRIDYSGPAYNSHEIKEGKIYIDFDNASRGLYAPNGLQGFEIAGPDKVFYPADARISDNRKVEVSSKKVSNPVAVRYAWSNWVEGSLYDTNLLPASSFRTDTWDEAVRAKN